MKAALIAAACVLGAFCVATALHISLARPVDDKPKRSSRMERIAECIHLKTSPSTGVVDVSTRVDEKAPAEVRELIENIKNTQLHDASGGPHGISPTLYAMQCSDDVSP